MVDLKGRIQVAAAGRVVSLKGEAVLLTIPACYVRGIEANLVPGVTRADFWEDLLRGDGSEISPDGVGPQKFCAAYSSSALVVNVFGPLHSAPQHLLLAGQHGFEDAGFEYKCPTSLRGKSPNLDLVAISDSLIVGVESKFTEILSPKEARFAASYERLFTEEIPAGWHGMYLSLKQNPRRFWHLDAAQLVKHYLGLRYHFRGRNTPKNLLYLFWEPSDGKEIPQFLKHRRELVEFKEEVDGGDVKFDYMSYPELWAEWLEHSQWSGMRTHVGHLWDRYAFPVGSGVPGVGALDSVYR